MTYEEFSKALKAAYEGETREYDADAFPGSAQWRKCAAFTRQIRDLTEQNPEHVARMEAEKEAAKKPAEAPFISESAWNL